MIMYCKLALLADPPVPLRLSTTAPDEPVVISEGQDQREMDV